MTLLPERQVVRSFGFTLIELLVVLAIISLIAGAVLQRSPTRRIGLQGRSIIRQMDELLLIARSTAIAQNRKIIVTLAAQGHGILATGLVTRDIPPPFVMSFNGMAKGNAIIFMPDGTSSGGGIVISGGVDSWSIAVEPRTGRVSVSPRP